MQEDFGMWEFIVLGYVPGTQIQLTFGWLTAAALVVTFGLDYKLLHAQKASKKHATRLLPKKTLGQLIHPIIAAHQ